MDLAKTLVKDQMKALKHLEQILSKPHSLMLQLAFGNEGSTEERVDISSV